jgi:peptidylprolyl isomerase
LIAHGFFFQPWEFKKESSAKVYQRLQFGQNRDQMNGRKTHPILLMFGLTQQENSMSQAKSGDTVKIHYTGTLDDGSQFDSSAGRDPLEFTVGSGQVIPGFEQAVEGMAVGDTKTVNIPAEDAYGPHHDQMVQDVPKSALPDDLEPEVGMTLQAQGPDGQFLDLTVTAVEEDSITVDGNHPLAGKALKFDLELVEIS